MRYPERTQDEIDEYTGTLREQIRQISAEKAAIKRRLRYGQNE